MSLYEAKTDPRTGYGSMIAVTWVETALTFGAVALRTWIRLTIEAETTTKVDIDDVFIWSGLLCKLAESILYTLVAKDIWDLLSLIEGTKAPWPTFMQDISFYLKVQFALVILFWTILWCSKAAFLALYYRLLQRYQGWQTKIGWFVVVFITASGYVICWALQFTSCQPFNDYFTLGACNTAQDVQLSNYNLYISTAFDIGSDLLIMVLPLSILYSLKLDKKNKAALAFVFASGFIIIVFASLRLGLNVPHGTTHVNPKWLAYMSTAESSIALIVACAPAFRRLFTDRKRRTSKARSAYTKGSRTAKEGTLSDEEATLQCTYTNSEKELSKSMSVSEHPESVELSSMPARATSSSGSGISTNHVEPKSHF